MSLLIDQIPGPPSHSGRSTNMKPGQDPQIGKEVELAWALHRLQPHIDVDIHLLLCDTITHQCSPLIIPCLDIA